jgi:DegV family protein with EDD domain
MEKIKIITDSTSDLPKSLTDQYDIEVIPLYVNIGEKTYLDGLEIKLDQLLKVIKEDNIFPTTAQINPHTFHDTYEKYLNEGYKIVSIHISSRMSGTYQSACIARDMLESSDIFIIDAQNVTCGLGLLVLKAYRMKEAGAGAEDITNEIHKAIPHVKSALAFDSLENLVKGGRLSKTAGVVGSLLGIKPILQVKEGEMAVMDKVRGSKKSINYVLNYLEKTGMKKDEPCILLQVDSKEPFETLKDNVTSKGIDFIEGDVGCVVGAHAGPGACGVFFLENY